MAGHGGGATMSRKTANKKLTKRSPKRLKIVLLEPNKWRGTTRKKFRRNALDGCLLPPLSNSFRCHWHTHHQLQDIALLWCLKRYQWSCFIQNVFLARFFNVVARINSPLVFIIYSSHMMQCVYVFLLMCIACVFARIVCILAYCLLAYAGRTLASSKVRKDKICKIITELLYLFSGF